jgi:uncharacterized protein YwqG
MRAKVSPCDKRREMPKPKIASGSIAELDALVASAGLQKHAAALRALALPSIRLAFKLAKPPKELGTTRAGGEPDLEVDSPFPGGATARTFLLQIDLADVAGLAGAEVLPSDGLLSFFINDGLGDTPFLGGGIVVYTPADAELARIEFPPEAHYEANKTAKIEFAESLSLPPDEWKIVKKLKLDAEYNDTVYNTLGYESWPKRPGWITSYHQLLGHHRNDYHDAPAAKEVGLLVLSSNDDLEWAFGDGNRLGFYIKATDLAKQRFDKAYSRYIDAC